MADTVRLFSLVSVVFALSTAMSVHKPHLAIKSVTVLSEEKSEDGLRERLSLELRGQGFHRGMEVRVTSERGSRGDSCSESRLGGSLVERWTNSTVATMSVELEPASSPAYTCVGCSWRTGGAGCAGTFSTLPNEIVKWVHQGEGGVLRRESADEWRANAVRERREAEDVRLWGLRVEDSSSGWDSTEEGVPRLRVGSSATLRLFGQGFAQETLLVLTSKPGNFGIPCEFPLGDQLQLDKKDLDEHVGLLRLIVPHQGDPDKTYFLCYRKGTTGWVHLGSSSNQALATYDKLIPLWLSILIILVCLSFSSLFSGLNLGLMSLDRTDLKIICNTGTEKERKYAQAIMPVREHGNYLLCSILLGNVMVNSTFTILLDDLTSGLIAVIASTLAIVIFGEITPQAICSRHGLAVGAKTITVTKLVMGLTCPLSYPISKILDKLLGEEIGAVYTRERLKELVKLTTEFNDLQKDEVNIISGALELSQKVVKDVMTKLEDVFMLSYDAVLDFETVSEIMKSGYSRVPVFEGERSNIVTMLYIKDLALIDPDDNMSLKTVCQFYQNNCYFVFEDTTLDIVFKQFKEGIKGHMAFVHRVNSEGEGDPFYETVGIVTLEDVIEELIQSEIMDETDVWTDNRSKKRRQERNRKQDFTVFAERSENQRIHISPQLTLATYQFLSTSVDPFKPDAISETVLRRLLKQDVFFHIKMKNKEKAKHDPHNIIYNQGKPVDYFVLILEGRVEVTVGRENLIFESGPFTYFGSQALSQNVGLAESPTNNTSQQLGSLQSVNLDSKIRTTFVPDYSVRALTEVFYMRVKRSLYLAAKRATLMEWSRKEESTAGDTFEDEVEKLMHTYGEDNRSQGSPDVTRTHSQQASGRGSPVILNNGGLRTGSEPVLCLPQTPVGPEAHNDETAQLLNT